MTQSPSDQFLSRCNSLLASAAAQKQQIAQAADWFAQSILAGGLVHLFGAGHSRMMVEEMWPRYGSFPGFHPIVELSMTYHNNVVGPNGQRQAMFLETVSGLADRILRNFDISDTDSAFIVSSSGANTAPIEMAQGFKARGCKVVAMVSREHAVASPSKHPSGEKLEDVADLVLDTGAPLGDAMVSIPGLSTPVAPGSTVGGAVIVNCIKAEVAQRLTNAGSPPKVLTAPAIVGAEQSKELFESAYDEHARRISRLYARLGETR